MGGELPELVTLTPDPARRERTRWAMRRVAREAAREASPGATLRDALAWSGAAACLLWALGVVSAA
jgi:hypothetical protein